MVKFNDEEVFHTETERLYLTRRYDGWYVVGRGMLLPVVDVHEGRQVISEMEAKDAERAPEAGRW